MTKAILKAARTLWDYHCINDAVGPVDVIIGLGSYDTRVAERAARLYLDGMASLVVFTGHSGNWTRGMYPASEAEAFAEIAMHCGMPRSAIMLEPQATNIGENIRYSRLLLPAEVSSAIFVTKPQTQRRVKATLSCQWPQITATVTAPLTDFVDQPTATHPLHSLIDEMTGDIQRILDYPAKGFQIPQIVPAEVLAAFEFLTAQGYNRHLTA